MKALAITLAGMGCMAAVAVSAFVVAKASMAALIAELVK
jgi:hypothetical protein